MQKHGHRVLLTVSHSVTPNEMWAVEVCYDAKNGMKLWKLGSMDYVMAIDQAGTREVDFAFRSVPDALRSYYQRFSDIGTLVSEVERVVLLSDLIDKPRANRKFGFAGVSRITSEPRPPVLAHAIRGGEMQVETELTFLATEQDLDIFRLGHRHPGHIAYEGCSGAPVISEHGELVGLVVGGCESDSTIRSLPLRFYASAVHAAMR